MESFERGKGGARKAASFDVALGERLRAQRLVRLFARRADDKTQALLLDLCETLAAKR